jgi:hypothetical protein
MNRVPAPERYGFTTFCDDIRNEVDGKVTYVGVYDGTMIFAVPFPVQIPKLGVSSTLILMPDDDLGYEFHVYLPGDLEGSPSVKSPAATSPIEKPQLPEMIAGDDFRIAIKFNVVFSPMVLTKEGLIEVRAVNKKGYMRVGRLRVSSTAEVKVQNSV